MMKRRELIAGLGGAAAAPVLWPLTARAQQPALPVIAVVRVGIGSSTGRGTATAAAIRKGLSEAGYVEGQNVTVEWHWVEDKYELLPALMADLVRRRVAVILAEGPAVPLAKEATTTIPIPIVVFAPLDPAKTGVVASLARPGGNLTGVTTFWEELNGKRMGLLHDLLPKAVRVAVLVDPNNGGGIAAAQEANRSALADAQEAARRLGLQIQIFNASTTGEIDAVFAALARDRPDALFVVSSYFFSVHRAQLITLTASNGIPTSYQEPFFVQEGGLMSYDADTLDLWRVCGGYVGRILKGAKPADLPVQRPTKFRFIINLKTARALGIEVPPQLLAITDEAID
jgi:putative ABC transport system substrate-binding protein